MNDRVQRLRRDLTEAVVPPTCPTGYRVRTFSADDTPAVHRLLEVGYAQGGGHVGAFEEWWGSLRDDDEFAPDVADSLIGYLYSTSFASKTVLGHLVEPFEKDLRNRLANLGSDDRFLEKIGFTIISGRKPR